MKNSEEEKIPTEVKMTLPAEVNVTVRYSVFPHEGFKMTKEGEKAYKSDNLMIQFPLETTKAERRQGFYAYCANLEELGVPFYASKISKEDGEKGKLAFIVIPGARNILSLNDKQNKTLDLLQGFVQTEKGTAKIILSSETSYPLKQLKAESNGRAEKARFSRTFKNQKKQTETGDFILTNGLKRENQLATGASVQTEKEKLIIFSTSTVGQGADFIKFRSDDGPKTYQFWPIDKNEDPEVLKQQLPSENSKELPSKSVQAFALANWWEGMKKSAELFAEKMEEKFYPLKNETVDKKVDEEHKTDEIKKDKTDEIIKDDKPVKAHGEEQTNLENSKNEESIPPSKSEDAELKEPDRSSDAITNLNDLLKKSDVSKEVQGKSKGRGFIDTVTGAIKNTTGGITGGIKSLFSNKKKPAGVSELPKDSNQSEIQEGDKKSLPVGDEGVESVIKGSAEEQPRIPTEMQHLSDSEQTRETIKNKAPNGDVEKRGDINIPNEGSESSNLAIEKEKVEDSTSNVDKSASVQEGANPPQEIKQDTTEAEGKQPIEPSNEEEQKSIPPVRQTETSGQQPGLQGQSQIAPESKNVSGPQLASESQQPQVNPFLAQNEDKALGRSEQVPPSPQVNPSVPQGKSDISNKEKEEKILKMFKRILPVSSANPTAVQDNKTKQFTDLHSKRDKLPRGIKQLVDVLEDTKLPTTKKLERIVGICKYKRAGSKVTRMFHEKVRGRDKNIEAFYREVGNINLDALKSDTNLDNTLITIKDNLIKIIEAPKTAPNVLQSNDKSVDNNQGPRRS